MKTIALGLLLGAAAWLTHATTDTTDAGLSAAPTAPLAVKRWKFPKPPGGGNAVATTELG